MNAREEFPYSPLAGLSIGTYHLMCDAIDQLRADRDDWRDIAGMAEREVDRLRAEVERLTEPWEMRRAVNPGIDVTDADGAA